MRNIVSAKLDMRVAGMQFQENLMLEYWDLHCLTHFSPLISLFSDVFRGRV